MWIVILVLVLLIIFYPKRRSNKTKFREPQFKTKLRNASEIYVRPKTYTGVLLDSDFTQIKPSELKKGYLFIKAEDFLGDKIPEELLSLSYSAFSLHISLKKNKILSETGVLYIEIPQPINPQPL